MGSGCKGLYSSSEKSSPKNGKDYNTSGSSSVKTVNSIRTTNNIHDVPQHGTPNSVSKNFRNGHLNSERYFDKNGNAYLDIDYTDHGNKKMHPHVPHEHIIHFDKMGKMNRSNEPEGGIKK